MFWNIVVLFRFIASVSHICNGSPVYNHNEEEREDKGITYVLDF